MTEHADTANATHPMISARAVKSNFLTFGIANPLLAEIAFNNKVLARDLKKPVIIDTLSYESRARKERQSGALI